MNNAFNFKHAIFLLLLLIFQFAIQGCDHEPVSPPKFQYNKEPKARQEVEFIFPDDVKPLRVDKLRVVYTIENAQCVPVDYTLALGGAQRNFTVEKDFRLLNNKKNSYVTSFYSDFINPDDYYGLGLCSWKIDNISLKFNIGHDVSLAVGGESLSSGRVLERACSRHDHQSRPVWGCLQSYGTKKNSEHFLVQVISN